VCAIAAPVADEDTDSMMCGDIERIISLPIMTAGFASSHR